MAVLSNKTLILGAATGYTTEDIDLFMRSLKYINFNGEVGLFIYASQLNQFNLYLSEVNFPFKVNLIETDSGKFYKKKISKKFRRYINKVTSWVIKAIPRYKEKFIYKFSYPHVARFFDYLRYLKNRDDFTHVILTDTRDVVFQTDPTLNKIDGLFLGLETSSVKIGDDSYNSRWIVDVYGEKYLNSIRDNQICCAGVTLGDVSSIEDYLNTMINEFLQLPYELMISLNYDQGIHNKLLYSNQFLSNLTLCQPMDSIISTIGTMHEDSLSLNSKNELLLSNGCIASIVHQYDRHSDIECKFRSKYLQDI
ncbi:hypothetical protein [Aggregatibacter kilianii]|uniref:hypothetical protein n=1 Tax=Aggregatibacter kilianii TaxID=2025884 RepID=UPI000D64B118|nr:hypothetical protein [Aggregatibacter kilianii]